MIQTFLSLAAFIPLLGLQTKRISLTRQFYPFKQNILGADWVANQTEISDSPYFLNCFQTDPPNELFRQIPKSYYFVGNNNTGFLFSLGSSLTVILISFSLIDAASLLIIIIAMISSLSSLSSLSSSTC